MVNYAAARKAMVDGQIRPSDVTLYPILKAFLSVPREAFVPRDKRAVAYMDQHIDIENGRAILAPRVFARMLDAINIQPDELVLNVGSDLGYSTAIIAQLAEAVIGVEEDEAMATNSMTRLVEENVDNAVIHHGPLVEGAPEHGPYDCLVVTGAIEIVPKTIAAQLKAGGRIVASRLSGGRQQISVGVKTDTGINWNAVYNAATPVLPGFEKAKDFAF